MNEEFIENEKKKNPNNFTAGHYEVGRYAWLLDNVTVIKPIKARGKLGFWNYDNKGGQNYEI